MERKEQVRLRLKLYKEQKDILQKHAAAILAFCVANDIEIAEGLEQANDIFASLADFLIKKGIYSEVKADYEKNLELLRAIHRQQPSMTRRAEP